LIVGRRLLKRPAYFLSVPPGRWRGIEPSVTSLLGEMLSASPAIQVRGNPARKLSASLKGVELRKVIHWQQIKKQINEVF
jgi:hypothetical protein